jgi:hypothetical protein
LLKEAPNPPVVLLIYLAVLLFVVTTQGDVYSYSQVVLTVFPVFVYSIKTIRFCAPEYVKLFEKTNCFQPAAPTDAATGLESYTKVAPVMVVAQSIAAAPKSRFGVSFRYTLKLGVPVISPVVIF